MAKKGSTTSTSTSTSSPSPLLSDTHLLYASVFLFALSVRVAVSLNPYSGEHSPPKYGDYEAQRHWMEVTYNLPSHTWYTNTTDNDLSYWGLDYPPLSAYFAQLVAHPLAVLDPDLVTLHASRGYETPLSRLLMRCTVLASDVILLFPAVYAAACTIVPEKGVRGMSRRIHLLVFFLTIPVSILIDHSHFQYNGVSTALFLYALVAILKRYDVMAAILYTLCVYFKQMNLYYSLAFLSVYISRFIHSFFRSTSPFPPLSYAARILSAIVLTTALVFRPWLHSTTLLRQITRRLFPLSRGLYEDKVANIWCTLSSTLPYHLRPTSFIPSHLLPYTSALTTATACAPFCAAAARRPYSTRALLLAMSGCAMSFYLLSFHVHEKQIMLPIVPLALLMHDMQGVVSVASGVAAMSVFPLLVREGAEVGYFGMIGIHMAVVMFVVRDKEDKKEKEKELPVVLRSRQRLYKWVGGTVAIVSAVLHLLVVAVNPGTKRPDLFTVGVTAWSCTLLCGVYGVLAYHAIRI